MGERMNIRRVWACIILATAAAVLILSAPDAARADPPFLENAPSQAPAADAARHAQELARAILARMAIAPRPAAGCGPATAESLRAAAVAAIAESNPARALAVEAIALAREQAPPGDPCLGRALEDVTAELPLFKGSMPTARPVRPATPSRQPSLPRPEAAAAGPIDGAGPVSSESVPPPASARSSRSPGATARPTLVAAPPKPAAPASPPPSVVADVSSQVQKLPVIYQPPKALLLHRPVSFKLVIEALGQGSAKGAFNGDTITAHAQISRTVTATLSGPTGVTITPLSPATQTVTDIANPTWLWDITAETPNPATLELSIASLVTIDGAAHPIPIEVYNAQIPVELSLTDRLQLFIGQVDPIWKWLIGVVTVAGGAIGWVLNWRLKLRRGGAKPDPA